MMQSWMIATVSTNTIDNVIEQHKLFNVHDVISNVVPATDGKSLKRDEVCILYLDYAAVTVEMTEALNMQYIR